MQISEIGLETSQDYWEPRYLFRLNWTTSSKDDLDSK